MKTGSFTLVDAASEHPRPFTAETSGDFLLKRITLLFAALVWVAIGSPAIAGFFEDGVAAHGRGDYAEAARLLRLAAEQGNAQAHYGLGHYYESGTGVPQDYAEAAQWYRLAAEQGNAAGQRSLGTLYIKGQGVLQDYAEAARLLRLAAEQGDAQAQNNLGILYGTAKVFRRTIRLLTCGSIWQLQPV